MWRSGVGLADRGSQDRFCAGGTCIESSLTLLPAPWKAAGCCPVSSETGRVVSLGQPLRGINP